MASRTKAKAAEVAARWSIPTVHDTSEAFITDENIEILDIAYSSDQ